MIRAHRFRRYLAIGRMILVDAVVSLFVAASVLWGAETVELPGRAEHQTLEDAQDADVQVDDRDEPRAAAGFHTEWHDEHGSVVVRAAPSLEWRAVDHLPDRHLYAGELRLRARGQLVAARDGEYHFRTLMRGRLRLVIDGKICMQPVAGEASAMSSAMMTLTAGEHLLEVDYAGDSQHGMLSLQWRGPGFPWEPLRYPAVTHYERSMDAERIARGEQLFRAHRCAACHAAARELPARRAPSLSDGAGHLEPAWLVNWLTETPPTLDADITPQRRMPYYGMSRRDALDLAAYLLGDLLPHSEQPTATQTSNRPDAEMSDEGRRLGLSLGCLACHSWRGLGSRDVWSGGELTHIGHKRSALALDRWLQHPELVNRDHRMPLVELTDRERQQLVMWLRDTDDRSAVPRPIDADEAAGARREHGAELFRKLRCGACHEFARDDESRHATRFAAGFAMDGVKRTSVREPSNETEPLVCQQEGQVMAWRYAWSHDDRSALRAYWSQVVRTASWPTEPHWVRATGAEIMQERQCLGCHARDATLGVRQHLPDLLAQMPHLGESLDRLVPPSLSHVGDKLVPAALSAAIRREGVSHRPWLAVRMPRYDGTPRRTSTVDPFDELERVTQWLTVDDGAMAENEWPVAVDSTTTDNETLRRAGAGLVTTDGFGCVSCHQVGSVIPERQAPGTRGPNLSQLGTRVRRSWFQRFTRDPARSGIRLEMPSIQLPVRGVLHEDLSSQLDAVWMVLDDPHFEPLPPHPWRVVRQPRSARLSLSAGEDAVRAIVIHDSVRAQQPSRRYHYALVVGFPHRHNVVYDFETAQWAQWRLGDIAQQRPDGKSWVWDLAGTSLAHAPDGMSEWIAVRNGSKILPVRVGQFASTCDALRHRSHGGVEWSQRVFLADDMTPGMIETVPIRQRMEPSIDDSLTEGIVRTIHVDFSISSIDRLSLRAWPVDEGGRMGEVTPDRQRLVDARRHLAVEIVSPRSAQFTDDGLIEFARDDDHSAELTLRYTTSVREEAFDVLDTVSESTPIVEYASLPGFRATHLPLPMSLMPTALTWDHAGDLMVGTLTGSVWRPRDTDGDQLEDHLDRFSDELPTPFGMARHGSSLDVLTRFGLLRHEDVDNDGQAEAWRVVAAGWGHTDDYHDWAVGLPRDAAGNYYVGLPCQQDQRSVEAAHWRGCVLRLNPVAPSTSNPHAYTIEVMTRGHRFPMGLALDTHERLLVTDNQGNYNPFNELNHVVAGRHFGFVNRVERDAIQTLPRVTPPAIQIPHPWTRSVNGICVVPTGVWHEYAGHVIGCEYDTRQLVRLSLEEVRGELQGAIYPMSLPMADDAPNFLGPVSCAMSPRGVLYVGSFRDSGWGGANNVGELVRVEMHRDALQPGITEMRATSQGFRITFASPVDRDLAHDVGNYTIESYFRVATPEYGGDDQGRRVERVTQADLADDGRSVDLRLPACEPGRVYSLRVQRLIRGDALFFPAEAHYTLHAIPEGGN